MTSLMRSKGGVLTRIASGGRVKLVVAEGEQTELFADLGSIEGVEMVEVRDLPSALAIMLESPFEKLLPHRRRQNVNGVVRFREGLLDSLLKQCVDERRGRVVALLDDPESLVSVDVASNATLRDHGLGLVILHADKLYEDLFTGPRLGDRSLARYMAGVIPFTDDSQRLARQSWLAARMSVGSLVVVLLHILDVGNDKTARMGDRAAAATDYLLGRLLDEATMVVIPALSIPAWADTVLRKHNFAVMDLRGANGKDEKGGPAR
jgi:hypothetical protein